MAQAYMEVYMAVDQLLNQDDHGLQAASDPLTHGSVLNLYSKWLMNVLLCCLNILHHYYFRNLDIITHLILPISKWIS